MKKTILSCLASLLTISAHASILSCPSPNLFYASGTYSSADFYLQTRTGLFYQSSYTDISYGGEGSPDRYLELFFLEFNPMPPPHFDSYSYDIWGRLGDWGPGFEPGIPSTFHYTENASGTEQFEIEGVKYEFFTSFSVDLEAVYNGEEWTGTGTWEYYTLPFEDLDLCSQYTRPEPAPESAPGYAVLGVWLGIGLVVKQRQRRHSGGVDRENRKRSMSPILPEGPSESMTTVSD